MVAPEPARDNPSPAEPGGRAVARYIACTTQDGFSIGEVGD
jgi:hypothetical protein